MRQHPGDKIRVLDVRGDRPTLEVGGHYVLSGTVTLASRDKATLALWSANGDVEPLQRGISVVTGGGEFQFDFRIRSPGYQHLSFYPSEGGESFGSTYFGQDPWVFRTE